MTRTNNWENIFHLFFSFHRCNFNDFCFFQGDVFIDIPHNASFNIRNFGSENRTYTVKLKDNINAFRGSKSMDIFLLAGQEKKGSFSFQSHAANVVLYVSNIIFKPSVIVTFIYTISCIKFGFENQSKIGISYIYFRSNREFSDTKHT